MPVYRIYIDEVGNHDLRSADNPNERFFSLTGVVLESGYTRDVLIPQMNDLKRRYFQQDPDEPVVLHRKELIHRRHPFHALRDREVENRFNRELLGLLEDWEYTTITVVMDKLEHRNRYATWRYHPYHYCLSVLLERYVMLLENRGARGDVMVESRGGKEDHQLKDSYARLYANGTDYVKADRWQARITSKELKLKRKRANVAGLQVADLIAHPSRREILMERRLVQNHRSTFGDRIVEIQRKSKYNRSSGGRIEGYGKKLLP